MTEPPADKPAPSAAPPPLARKDESTSAAAAIADGKTPPGAEKTGNPKEERFRRAFREVQLLQTAEFKGLDFVPKITKTNVTKVDQLINNNGAGPTPYVLMELVDGITLFEYVYTNHPKGMDKEQEEELRQLAVTEKDGTALYERAPEEIRREYALETPLANSGQSWVFKVKKKDDKSSARYALKLYKSQKDVERKPVAKKGTPSKDTTKPPDGKETLPDEKDKQNPASRKWIIECVELTRNLLHMVKRISKLGVRHRDIKPLNIMVRKDKSLVLLDFGLAYYSKDPDDAYLNGLLSDDPDTRLDSQLGNDWFRPECLTQRPAINKMTQREQTRTRDERRAVGIDISATAAILLWCLTRIDPGSCFKGGVVTHRTSSQAKKLEAMLVGLPSLAVEALVSLWASAFSAPMLSLDVNTAILAVDYVGRVLASGDKARIENLPSKKLSELISSTAQYLADDMDDDDQILYGNPMKAAREGIKAAKAYVTKRTGAKWKMKNFRFNVKDTHDICVSQDLLNGLPVITRAEVLSDELVISVTIGRIKQGVDRLKLSNVPKIPDFKSRYLNAITLILQIVNEKIQDTKTKAAAEQKQILAANAAGSRAGVAAGNARVIVPKRSTPSGSGKASAAKPTPASAAKPTPASAAKPTPASAAKPKSAAAAGGGAKSTASKAKK